MTIDEKTLVLKLSGFGLDLARLRTVLREQSFSCATRFCTLQRNCSDFVESYLQMESLQNKYVFYDTCTTVGRLMYRRNTMLRVCKKKWRHSIPVSHEFLPKSLSLMSVDADSWSSGLL